MKILRQKREAFDHATISQPVAHLALSLLPQEFMVLDSIDFKKIIKSIYSCYHVDSHGAFSKIEGSVNKPELNLEVQDYATAILKNSRHTIFIEPKHMKLVHVISENEYHTFWYS